MKEYVIITGGELFNKGAQSMTFIAVDQLKQKFPNAEIVVLSASDFKRSEEDKSKFNFTILPFSISWIYDLAGGALKRAWALKNIVKKSKKTDFEEYKITLDEILNHTVAWVDVSGYALSSQFRINRSVSYLLTILLAKKRNIPMIIMPQSFGPFDYSGKNAYIVDRLMKVALKHPVKIYARENEGYKNLKQLGYLDNIEKSNDMVLLNQNLNLDNVYAEKPKLKTFDGYSGVGLVPNKENFNHGDNETVLNLYRSMIVRILNSGKEVVIIRHSHNDADVCEKIYSLFADNKSVKLLNEEISSIEYGQIVEQLDFVIGSRFHAIVHAYKHSVPCIALGWATKYKELLRTFDQEDYNFDVRVDPHVEQINSSIDKMVDNYQEESNNIKLKLTELQTSTDLFEPFN